MNWENIKLSDLPTPTDAEIEALASLVDEFEENHQEALEHEAEVSAISPAVFACDLFKRPKNPVTAVLPDFFYSGAITGIFAAPKVGKSLLLCHLLEAVASGTAIFGTPTTKSRVLYVTEQNEQSFREQSEDVPHFKHNRNLAILLIEANKCEGQDGKMQQITKWEHQLAFWEELLRRTDATVFVIDILGALFHLPMGGENDNSTMQSRMATLRRLFDIKPNLSIVLSHHNRKEDRLEKHRSKYGCLADSRGASAIAGALDQAITMTAEKGTAIRYLKFEGRYRESNSMTWDIELKSDESYVKRFEDRPSSRKGQPPILAAEVRNMAMTSRVLGVLESHPKGLTMAKLEAVTGYGRSFLTRTLEEVKAKKTGLGTKSEPTRYLSPDPEPNAVLDVV